MLKIVPPVGVHHLLRIERSIASLAKRHLFLLLDKAEHLPYCSPLFTTLVNAYDARSHQNCEVVFADLRLRNGNAGYNAHDVLTNSDRHSVINTNIAECAALLLLSTQESSKSKCVVAFKRYEDAPNDCGASHLLPPLSWATRPARLASPTIPRLRNHLHRRTDVSASLGCKSEERLHILHLV